MEMTDVDKQQRVHMRNAVAQFAQVADLVSGAVSAAGLAPVNHVRAFLKNGDNPAQARK